MSAESRRLAGILLVVLPTVMIGGVSILSLVVLRYVDEAALSAPVKWLVRLAAPVAAILVPAAFFLSVLSPDAKEPSPLIYLAYVGAVILAAGVLTLGVGLLRK